MSDLTAWLEGNDRYLEAALTWLRRRLTRLADRFAATLAAVSAPIELAPQPAAPTTGFWRRPAAPVVMAPTLTELPATDVDAEIDAAREAMLQAAADLTPPPALVQVAEAFELGDFARDLLLLCAAPELDPGIGRTLATLQGQPWPTYALAAQLFDHPDWESRSPDGPLRQWHLIEADAVGGQGLSTCPLHVDERILNAIKGLDHLDSRLTGALAPVSDPGTTLPPSQQHAVAATIQAATRSVVDEPVQLLQLVGPSSASRRAVARNVAAAYGTALLRLVPRLLPAGADEIELLARLWHREVVLHSRVLLLDDDDQGPLTPEGSAFLSRTGGLVLVGTAEVIQDLPATVAIVDVAHPTVEEQLELWQAAAAGIEAEIQLDQIVEQFDLDTDSIAAIAAGARSGGEQVTADQLWLAARQHLRPRLEAAAARVRPLATWDDLVLPEPQLRLLRHIGDQVRNRHRVHREWGFAERMNRGLGVSALFAGESGTGKSMTAEVLANDLNLDLYRIDLSAVVSKYIGETEKNLRKLFDAAESGGVILFFDEADALFGKRSEVKDAHDRYANIETNYLLQRMEQYGGLAILATNMRSALDRAFARRLRFVVEFPFPARAERAELWRRAFPGPVDVEDLDVDRLSRIDLNGAGVSSAALAAAFMAAAEDRDIVMSDVMSAAREELRKLQRPVNEAHFRSEQAS